MVHSRDFVKSAALCAGILPTIFALTRIIVFSVYSSRSDDEWPYDLLRSSGFRTPSLFFPLHSAPPQDDGKISRARLLLMVLAIVNAVELIFDLILIYSIIKNIARYLLVWTCAFIIFIFINIGLVVGLSITFFEFDTSFIAFSLFGYMAFNGVMSIIILIVVQGSCRQTTNTSVHTSPLPNVYYYGDTGGPVDHATWSSDAGCGKGGFDQGGCDQGGCDSGGTASCE